jgi:hypothetical protein
VPVPVVQAVMHLPWPIFIGVVVVVALYYLVKVARSQ